MVNILRLPLLETTLKKRTFTILVFSILISFFALSHAPRVDSITDMGGCFKRNDAKLETKVSDHPACLQVFAMEGCLKNIELYIRNDCDETFTYEMNGGTYEIYNYDDWLRESQSGNTSAVTDVTDRTVSQEFGKWSKVIGYKNDPSKKITVDVTVKSKNSQILINEKTWLALILVVGATTVVSIAVLGIKLLGKRGKLS